MGAGGMVISCMAETMMLALAHHYEHMSIGADLNLEGIAYVRRLAAEHGFHITDLRSFDRPLTEREWQAVVGAREADKKVVSLRQRKGGEQSVLPLAELIGKLQKEVADRQ